MKVLVTGGAGFIGSHIVDQLLAEGHQVVVVDDLSTGSLDNVNPQASFVRLSVLDGELLGLFEREKFDAALHLAAQTIVGSSLEHPDIDARVNVLGTLQVLEGCRQHGVERIIFASTAAVYGDTADLPVPEEAPGQPASFYGLSKLTAERYIQMYHALYGLNYLILRYANVFGERQGDRGEGGVVSIFAGCLCRNNRLNIYGDGGQTRDFVYVGDVAAANVAAVTTPQTNRILNISSQTETSVNELASLFAEIAGEAACPAYHPARSGDILRSTLRNREACAALDWQPRIGLREGLERTYKALRRTNP
ncbi:MAG: NAD-dependent epimerase/dehydratase family protein [Negativicutes bacterium]|nr:NAD-dependent epimerase/dehydratase family protein [Negativicutes bacterium]